MSVKPGLRFSPNHDPECYFAGKGGPAGKPAAKSGRAWLWRLAALLMAAAVVVSCQTPAASARPVEIGMCVRMLFTPPAEVQRQFDLMEQMNVKLVRVDFDWSAIEGEKGRYDWSYTDLIARQAADHNMQVLGLLTYTPGWARPPGTDSHVPPTEAADFAEFARAAANRYAPQGLRSWEIWNEPNSSDYWVPRPDVDRYGELFRAASAAIHDVDGGATVMTGGLTRGTDTADGSRISQTTFIDGLYLNGAAQAADAIAVHPYSFPSLPAGDAGGPVGGLADLPALHDLMQRNGDGGKKIWITEFGAATGSSTEAMSDTDQAASLLQARQLVETWDWAGPLIFYEFRDAGTDPADLEQNFGVVRADLTLKDAGVALKD
ncbi:cellulase family glycosylhydrolase [Mycolicibacterium sp. CR10]|uniref:cellulase family glycosylhydrolase n=1 Tax=Mycolicibacterium sp. CR10 TaxID=2562314 RepID=UPI001F0DE617|nr:cellulase family glycosylhydrolase [Mycolicibacterium sp. CR10]